jgi:hypothetical protein
MRVVLIPWSSILRDSIHRQNEEGSCNGSSAYASTLWDGRNYERIRGNVIGIGFEGDNCPTLVHCWQIFYQLHSCFGFCGSVLGFDGTEMRLRGYRSWSGASVEPPNHSSGEGTSSTRVQHDAQAAMTTFHVVTLPCIRTPGGRGR